jgi:aspartate/methionine/tyrosine aminotransferase
MSQNLRTMEYAVRGKVVIKADEINAELISNPENNPYPFDHIVYTNIGNPHSVGQKALTWPRQVLSLVDLPEEVGVDHPVASKIFPADAIDRARLIKKGLNGHGSGAYTHSQGPLMFRKDICKFIEERDDLEVGSTDPKNIFMTNGASSGINMILNALIADPTW